MADNFDEKFNKLKLTVQEQYEKIYKEGANAGSVATAITIYRFLEMTGLEKSNLLYSILQDIAKEHGCNDIEEEIKKRFQTQKDNNSKPTLLS